MGKSFAGLTSKYMLWKPLTCWIHSHVALGMMIQVLSLLWTVSDLICVAVLPVVKISSGFAVFL